MVAVKVIVALIAMGVACMGETKRQIDDRCMNEQTHRVIQRWQTVQANSSAPVVIIHPQYGLGNRMLSVASAFALSLSTSRRFFVEWEEPFESLFEPAFDLHLSSFRREGARNKMLRMDLTANSPFLQPSSEKLGCHDVMSDTMSFEIISDQYFLPLLLVNPFIRKNIQQIGSDLRGCLPELHGSEREDAEVSHESLILTMIARWLFRPNKRIRKAVDTFEMQRGGGRCEVGVHLRTPMFEFEYKQVPQVDSEVALECGRNLLLNRSSDTSAGGGEEAGWMFLSTTSDEVKVLAREMLAGNVTFTRGATKRLQEDGRGETQALMDLLLLSRCRSLVASVHSTFSYSASMFSPLRPWVVTSATRQVSFKLMLFPSK